MGRNNKSGGQSRGRQKLVVDFNEEDRRWVEEVPIEYVVSIIICPVSVQNENNLMSYTPCCIFIKM